MALSKIVSSSLANGAVSVASITDNTVTSAKLTSTGVVANSYGNTTAIPVITIDQAGRITNATTSSVSGVTGLSYAAANSTVTVSTSTTNFDAVVTSGNSTVQGLLKVIDSVSNTDAATAASANSVTTAYQLAANAVSNATAYAATAYSNAVSVASSDATTKADTAYSNATSYAATIAGTAYSNAVSVASSDATTKAGTAYSNATSYAATIAGTAYSNAVSVAASDATTKADTAYSNATSYAATIAGTAYSNAVTYTDIKAGNAYSNAASYADTKAATAYSNVFNGGTFSGAVVMQANLTANSVRMNGSLVVDGDLTVSGNTVTINVTNLNVEDNMIYLNSNSTVTHPDLGFAGNYNDGSYKHAGLFRDATDGVWKFFHGYTPEPDASVYIDTSNASFTYSNLQVNYVIGNVTGSANSATYLGGNTATTLRSYSDTVAGTAYTNATSYADTKAGTAYSNAVSVASSDATTKAGTAYTNATSYADTKAGTAYTNATSYAATIAGTAYTNATSYAATIAGTAYSNAVSVASSDATTKAGTAYTNATSYAATIAGTAYSNAVSVASSDATTKAGTAYSNAVSYAASNSYVNSTFLKLSGGTMTGAVTFNNAAPVTIYGSQSNTNRYIKNYDGPLTSWQGTAGATSMWGLEFTYASGYRRAMIGYDHASTEELQIASGYGPIVFNVNWQNGNLTSPNDGTEQLRLSTYALAPVSMRSPIFYDSDDTGYYVDPNSTSSMWNVNIRGDSSSTATGNQIFFWGSGSTTTSAIGFKANGGNFANPTGNGDGYNTYLTMDTDGRGWVFRRGTGGTDFTSAYTSGWILNNGVWQAQASMRAPIFYDSNDTGYYTNPNAGSSIKYMQVTGDWGSSPFSSGQETFTIRSTYGSITQRSTNGALSYWLHHLALDGAYYLYGGRGATDGNSWEWSYRAWPNQDGNYVEFRTSARAPIFYDRDDTSYYVDPASSSQLKGHTRFGPYAGSISSGNQSGVEIMNNSGTGDGDVACISFHCAGTYGAHLHLRHDGYMGIGGWSASTWRWYTYLPSGDMTAAGNVTAYSDPRLKEEVVTIVNAVDKIKQLNGVKFKWKETSVIGHPGEYDYGVLSSDVQKIAPELVVDSIHDAPEGDRYKTVAYDKLVAFTIEAIKEQQREIEELKRLVNKLIGS